MSTRVCSRCAIEKDDADFYGGRDTRCRACLLEKKRKHYEGRKAGVIPTVAVEFATCPDCATLKPVSDFGVDHARNTGLKLYCKPCVLVRLISMKYGLSATEYRTMRDLQNNLCAICGESETALANDGAFVRNLCVDHDHKTGQVRGLLCDGCNVALGRMRDDPNRMMAAAAYLLQYENVLGGVL